MCGSPSALPSSALLSKLISSKRPASSTDHGSIAGCYQLCVPPDEAAGRIIEPMSVDVIGIGLAGGQGMRARPLTLKAPGYLRSKAAMAFLGRRLIRWVLQILSTEGIKEYYVIAHGKENRYQIK